MSVQCGCPTDYLGILRHLPTFALGACLLESAEFPVFPDRPAAAYLFAIKEHAGYPPGVDVAETVGLDRPPYTGLICENWFFFHPLRAWRGGSIRDSVVAVAGLLAATHAQLPPRILTLLAASAKSLFHIFNTPESGFAVLPPPLLFL